MRGSVARLAGPPLASLFRSASLHQDAAVHRVADTGVVGPGQGIAGSGPGSPGSSLAGESGLLAGLVRDIHNELSTSNPTLQDMATYYFDGAGKAVRPLLTLSMAGACNSHLKVSSERVMALQKQIAVICEMFHTSSLLHDDVIDHAETRRGKESVNCAWNPTRSVFAGVYILSISTKLLGQTNNPDVVECMSQILFDLVNGEFQQMASRDDKDDRFQLYLDKTFNKTASLMANACKAVALLANEGNAETNITDMAYKYGQNIGIAFQLVDDWLDFVSSADQLGKPSAADLQLGLATAPVLFASEQFPELNSLILRRFAQQGDAERAFELVWQSEGLQMTRNLANKYSQAALASIQGMHHSHEKEKLVQMAHSVINRMK